MGVQQEEVVCKSDALRDFLFLRLAPCGRVREEFVSRFVLLGPRGGVVVLGCGLPSSVSFPWPITYYFDCCLDKPVCRLYSGVEDLDFGDT